MKADQAATELAMELFDFCADTSHSPEVCLTELTGAICNQRKAGWNACADAAADRIKKLLEQERPTDQHVGLAYALDEILALKGERS